MGLAPEEHEEEIKAWLGGSLPELTEGELGPIREYLRRCDAFAPATRKRLVEGILRRVLVCFHPQGLCPWLMRSKCYASSTAGTKRPTLPGKKRSMGGKKSRPYHMKTLERIGGILMQTHLRPMGIGEIFDRCFYILRTNFGTLVKLHGIAFYRSTSCWPWPWLAQ